MNIPYYAPPVQPANPFYRPVAIDIWQELDNVRMERDRALLSKFSFPEDYQFIFNIYRDKCGNNKTKTANYLKITWRRVDNAVSYMENPAGFERKKPGPNRILQEEHIDYITTVTQASPRLYNAGMADKLKNQFPDIQHCSPSTISRARKEQNFRFRSPKKSCFMTQFNKDVRVGWSLNHIENETNFDNVVFSDESWFEFGPDNRYLWAQPKDYRPEVCAAHKKFEDKVLVWGAIGKNFKSQLIFWEGSVKTENYVPTLVKHNFFSDANEHFGEGKWLFQQDNATPHTANDTLNKLQELGINLLENWPSASPDLNIIENIWAIMKRRLAEKQVKTFQQMKQELLNVWNSISYQTINALVDSIPKRIQEVVKKQGNTIFLNELK